MKKKIKIGYKNNKKMVTKVMKSPIKKFLSTMFKILAVFSVVLAFAVAGIVLGSIFGYIKTTEPIPPGDLILKGFTSNVYDSKNNVVLSLKGDKNREMVDFKDIPNNLKNAFIAIEDERFYSHAGVDLRSVLSAILNQLKASGDRGGASTITQQVIKNITGDTERSLKRKIQEQWRAVQLERELSKDQILEVYLNLIYIGENCYGVQAAAKTYFDKDVRDLTLAECASIAGITNWPEKYDPFIVNGNNNGKENNIKRQRIILKKMLDLKYITKGEYNDAIKEKLEFSQKKNSDKSVTTQSYFVDQVILEVKKGLIEKGYSEDLALKMIYNNGLKIYTTLDSDIQKAMDSVFTNPKYFSVVNNKAGQPQGAMVILDAANAQIRALYGGVGEKVGTTFNRASSKLMQRQPGSTFKPISAYAPALNERKITAATVVDDVPVYMGDGNARYPQNYDHLYRGLLTIRDGVKSSINVVAAKTWLNLLGPNLSLDYLKKVDINRDDEKYVSLSLGGLKKGVNPIELAAAYVPFVNKGMYVEPIIYTRVEDMRGNVLLEKKLNSRIVYDEGAAYIMTDILRDVTRKGTAYPYGLLKNGDMPTAGKTGTTSDNKDKWFVGYTPYYVGTTWYGYDKPTEIWPTEYNRALIVWHDVMEAVHKDKANIAFNEPQGIVRKNICIYSGKTPCVHCSSDPRGSSIREEIFIKGTEPKDDDICNVHKRIKICTSDKDIFGRYLLKGSLCPNDTVEEIVVVERTQKYVPKGSEEPYPLDWKYEIPDKYCRVHTANGANEITETKSSNKNKDTDSEE